MMISTIQDNLLVASQHGKANDAGRCCTASRHALNVPLYGRDIAQDLQRATTFQLRSQ